MEPKKQLFFIGAVAGCAICIFIVMRIFSDKDTSKIRKAVYVGALAIEKKDVHRVEALISGAYVDAQWRSKKDVCQFVAKFFEGYKDFNVVIKLIKPEVNGSRATADVGLTVYMRKIDTGKRYYESGKLALDFVNEEGHWRVIGLTYAGKNEILFLQSVA